MFELRGLRRRKLRELPLPDGWWSAIDRNVPYARTLSAEDRRELAGSVQILLAEKNFEGCGGLVLTDEIRVTIAAQTAVLLLRRDTDYSSCARRVIDSRTR